MTPKTITKIDEERPSLVEQLEQYFEAWDTRRFGDLVQETDWSERRPEELERAISLSFSMNQTRLVRELAALGGQLFPDHEYLQHLAYVFAPTTARIVKNSKPSTSLYDSMDWFSEHGSEYQGQYVAVKDGIFLGAAPTIEELATFVQFDDLTLVTRVL
jgi:hypothetical protein